MSDLASFADRSGRPRITVVMPSYQQGQFLAEAMDSVLDQGYPDLEFIVLDAGSTDGSSEVIEARAEQLTHWRSAPDEGQAAALREGFGMATGDVLTWLNSDDKLEQGALGAVADAWVRHGGDVIVAGCVQLFEDRPTKIHRPSFGQQWEVPAPLPQDRVFDMAHHWFPGEFFYQPEVFFPRSAYERVGGIDPGFYYTMDYDLWARFAIDGTPVVCLDRVLAWYREHDQQKTANRQALFDEMVATANAYLPRTALPARRQARLRRWNLAARSGLVREGCKLLHRFSGASGVGA